MDVTSGLSVLFCQLSSRFENFQSGTWQSSGHSPGSWASEEGGREREEPLLGLVQGGPFTFAPSPLSQGLLSPHITPVHTEPREKTGKRWTQVCLLSLRSFPLSVGWGLHRPQCSQPFLCAFWPHLPCPSCPIPNISPIAVSWFSYSCQCPCPRGPQGNSLLSVGSHFPGVTPRDGQVLRGVGTQWTLSTWDRFGLWPSLISPLQSLGIVQLAAKGHSSALQAGRL